MSTATLAPRSARRTASVTSGKRQPSSVGDQVELCWSERSGPVQVNLLNSLIPDPRVNQAVRSKKKERKTHADNRRKLVKNEVLPRKRKEKAGELTTSPNRQRRKADRMAKRRKNRSERRVRREQRKMSLSA